MQKFTVKIDLSAFFDDERKLVLILVDPDWESVEMLQKRVEKVFNVHVQFLTKDGCFIPPEESIEVIKYVNEIKAFLPKKSLEKRKSSKKSKLLNKQDKFEKEFISADNEIENVEKVKKNGKRKFFALENGFTSSTPNHSEPKRCKNVGDNIKHSLANHLCNKSNEITSTSEQITLKEMQATSSPIELLSHIRSDMRSSHQPQRKPTKRVININGTTSNKSKVNSNLHIYYDTENDGEMITTNDNDDETIIQKRAEKIQKTLVKTTFHCNLDEADKEKPRIFQIKPLIEIQEHIVIKPLENHDVFKANGHSVKDVIVDNQNQIQDSLITEHTQELISKDEYKENQVDLKQSNIIDLDENSVDDTNCTSGVTGDESNVIDLNDTDTKHDSNNKCTQQESTSTTLNVDVSVDMTIEKLLPYSTPLVDLPEVDDIVIFKTYYCSEENKKQIISNFIAGKTEYTNKRTKNVKLLVIDGHAEINGIPSKYVCNMDESTENKYLNVKLTEMIEPFVFKMS